MKTLGVYIQVPFCQTKCTYCNFHTGVVSRERYAPYAAAVRREIEAWLAESANGELSESRIDTVYFGGGTPSLLEPSALASVLGALEPRFADASAMEITLEADPETIDASKAAAWREAGFNRISLGVQSFNDDELKATGRMHRRVDIFNAAQILRGAGFDNISMDLIAGLPRQTRESWEESVGELLAIRPEHVSIYMLEIDEGSRLGRESLAGGSRYSAGAIPEDDAIAEFYESARARLAAAGYEHYEISNWGLPGKHSRHNLKYWRREPYIGFGAGAHSFDGRVRWANVHDSTRYVAGIDEKVSTREQVEPVTAEQALEEEFFLGLRQMEGIDLHRIERAYDAELHEQFGSVRSRLEALRAQGLVEMDGDRVRLSPQRLTVSNEVFTELMG
ncbi:MAG TPA: radical SAM family heme chaperone HemW [Candidatus Acidoferrales bacterium]|jgi:oxygen-independent coproporphyrinogen-3 oxidase|nr:radical SAM family heme chaperone HemW [Candidatus Acidoferrales bacterium]